MQQQGRFTLSVLPSWVREEASDLPLAVVTPFIEVGDVRNRFQNSGLEKEWATGQHELAALYELFHLERMRDGKSLTVWMIAGSC